MCLLSSHYRHTKKVNERVRFCCISILFIVLEHIISPIYHCRTLFVEVGRAAEEVIYPRMPLLLTVGNDRTFTVLNKQGPVRVWRTSLTGGPVFAIARYQDSSLVQKLHDYLIQFCLIAALLWSLLRPAFVTLIDTLILQEYFCL